MTVLTNATILVALAVVAVVLEALQALLGGIS